MAPEGIVIEQNGARQLILPYPHRGSTIAPLVSPSDALGLGSCAWILRSEPMARINRFWRF